jgi:acid phosphatase family membrane protein YuiD
MITLAEIITNKFLIGAVITVALAQSIKAITNTAKGNRFSLRHLIYGVGGMPSSHSAAVSYITASVLFIEGISSLFVASLIFSAIVLRDALGVRHNVGEQGRILNKLQKAVLKKEPKVKEFSESVGHTLIEVIAGVILGIAVSVIMNLC